MYEEKSLRLRVCLWSKEPKDYAYLNNIHNFISPITEMRDAIRDMNDQLGEVSVGQDAIRRLNAINDTVKSPSNIQIYIYCFIILSP